MRTYRSDREVLDQLVARFPSINAAADALGLGDNIQFFYNWRARGVPRGWRRTVWLLCKQRGLYINKNWCKAGKSPRERANLEKSLRLVARANGNGGTTYGKPTGRKRSEPKGQRPPQRRSTAGRSVPALAR